MIRNQICFFIMRNLSPKANFAWWKGKFEISSCEICLQRQFLHDDNANCFFILQNLPIRIKISTCGICFWGQLEKTLLYAPEKTKNPAQRSPETTRSFSNTPADNPTTNFEMHLVSVINNGKLIGFWVGEHVNQTWRCALNCVAHKPWEHRVHILWMLLVCLSWVKETHTHDPDGCETICENKKHRI